MTVACQIKENIVTWPDLRAATEADPVMQDIIKIVREGLMPDTLLLMSSYTLISSPDCLFWTRS